MIKHHEFWHPRLFEIPYYCALLFQCLLKGIDIKTLAKANYALDHGDIGIGSKYQSQMQFDQGYFLPTQLVPASLSVAEKETMITAFASQHGFPLILKSDIGCVGKGICKINDHETLKQKVPLLLGDYIVQQFTPFSCEYGIFFTRYKGVGSISGMNKKHFPTVVGNGSDNLHELVRQHPRYTHHWQAFLQNLNMDRIPDEGENVRLSFIGSHTLGCKFTDDTHRITPVLEKTLCQFFDSQPGFNFGRCDVKAESDEALLAGKFVVIEVNGVASLPTHMFDPDYSLWQAYRIFLKHSQLLASIAKEHRQRVVPLLPYREIIRQVKDNQNLLDQVHQRLKAGSES